MNRLAPFFLTASLCFASGIPSQQNIYGEYIEARTADVYTGPCFGNSEGGNIGELAVFGWKINKGSWQGVSLDGLSVVAAVRAQATLGDIYHDPGVIKSIVIVDDKATPEQRVALRGFAQRMGGNLLRQVVKVEAQPIELTFAGDNVHSTSAKLTAGTLADIQTRSLNAKDHVCSNEEIYYQPLTKLDHAMPAYVMAHNFKGQGLGATWSDPDKRSSFVGSFAVPSE
jgi:hypothetical protein